MSEDEFRAFFNGARNANELLSIGRCDGSKAIAVGLNAGNVVLHGGGEVPLERLGEADWDIIYERAK